MKQIKISVVIIVASLAMLSCSKSGNTSIAGSGTGYTCKCWYEPAPAKWDSLVYYFPASMSAGDALNACNAKTAYVQSLSVGYSPCELH